MKITRKFTQSGSDPFATVKWVKRSSRITNPDGSTVFQMDDAEVPETWSQLATDIMVSKYFRKAGVPQVDAKGKPVVDDKGKPVTGPEKSARQVIHRLAGCWKHWGEKHGYFDTPADAQAFYDELAYMMTHQHAAPNSPQWFNTGLAYAYGLSGPAQGHFVPDPKTGKVGLAKDAYTHPQPHACFIQSVTDDLVNEGGIMDLWVREGRLFKYGSGTGTNFSNLRGENESLSGGGKSSGLMSWLKIGDRAAGAIKSGGTTRRAAKMVCLDMDHPDIEKFINWKVREEIKVAAMVEGMKNLPEEMKKDAARLKLKLDYDFNGEAYSTVSGQNSNNSVRIPDSFFEAVDADGEWATRFRTNGKVARTFKAADLWDQISYAAWRCADPGVQFDSTINAWHTCPNGGRINASNPCSEYMFLDDSACNLASLNLMHFRTIDGDFDVTSFKHAVDVVLLAQEILVDFSKYPTQRIAENSYAYRPLGLGYANLGALLMASGLPYDSDEGRNFAAAITALMHGQANLQSAKMAEKMGPFSGYAKNAEPMNGVMRRHRKAAYQIPAPGVAKELHGAAKAVWDEVVAAGEEHGFRNGQVTVLAPTGTIGFMMDCDTTGIEPDIALIKYKKLVGGGMLKIVNQTVPQALEKLGYSQAQVAEIIAFLDKNDTIEGAPHLAENHLPVFDCAFKPAKGTRSIHWLGHIAMMGAVQPFLSGAISKTVNMPHESTVEDIEKAYMESWRQGLKAVAVYRDGCKRSQPLNTSKSAEKKEAAKEVLKVEYRTERRRLPDERQSITHKFSIGGHEGYLTVGMYEDNTPGELFCVMAKEGSVVSGLMDSFATSVSLALQYGVPLQVLVDKFSHTRFEPSGFTGNPQIPIAKSITDYIFRWLSLKFLPSQQLPLDLDAEAMEKSKVPAAKASAGTVTIGEKLPVKVSSSTRDTYLNQADAPPCHTCGAIMIRSGACYKCSNCGATSGCS